MAKFRLIQSLASWPAVTVLLAALLGAGPASASCIDYQDYLHWEGEAYDPISWFRAVAVDGDYAYTLGSSELQVYAIAGGGPPVPLGRIDLPGDGAGDAIATRNGFAYVADHQAGLVTIDATDPSSPAITSIITEMGWVTEITVAGDHCYVDAIDFNVLDLTDPAVPAVVGTLHVLDGSCEDIAVSGDHAYLIYDWPGLYVLDVSDPSAPRVVGNLDLQDRSQAVAVEGATACIVSASGMNIIDVSDPAAPALVAFWDSPGDGLDVALSADSAFLALGGSGLQVVDIFDVTAPQFAGQIGHYMDCIAISGDRAYTGANRWLQVLDISNPSSPGSIGSVDTPGRANAVTVAGNRAYVADGSRGLQVISIANPALPWILGSVNTTGLGNAVALQWPYVYLADDLVGLQVIDVTDSTSPEIVATMDTPGAANGVVVGGTLAYVADSDQGLHVVDISNPIAPRVVGSVTTADDALAVAVSGTIAAVATNYAGLTVIDVSEPTAPRIIGTLDMAGSAGGIALSDSLAYLALGGLKIIDLSDPTAPEIIGEVFGFDAQAVALDGSYAYVAEGVYGAQVIDVSDALSPRWAGSVPIPGVSRGVAVGNGLVYVGGSASGLHIIPAQCAPQADVAEPVAGSAGLVVAPNPSPRGSEIHISLAPGSPGMLFIQDVTGRTVRRLRAGGNPGVRTVVWDGCDDALRPLPPGLYFVRAPGALNERGTGRCVLLR